MPGAVRSRPRPVGPICSTSCASAGKRAVAPPNSTANRSSEIAPSMMGRDQTKCRPSSRVDQLTGSRLTICGAGVVARISSTDNTSSADEIR